MLIESVYMGETVESEGSARQKLGRLTPRETANRRITEKQRKGAEKKLQAEMWAEIEKDWAEI